MSAKRIRCLAPAIAAVIFGAALAIAAETPQQADKRSASQQAQAILKASGVQGGLIVHFGCGDGKLTVALRANR